MLVTETRLAELDRWVFSNNRLTSANNEYKMVKHQKPLHRHVHRYGSNQLELCRDGGRQVGKS